MDTLQEIARTAAESFETATRPDESTFTRRKDGAPDWVQDLCMEAHGEMFPDDWRYACTAAACEAIADADDADDASHDFADAYVDVYNSALFEWLASNLTRQGYCDEAREEYGAADSIVGDIQRGQYAEALEVYELVLGFLRDKAEDAEAAALFGEES